MSRLTGGLRGVALGVFFWAALAGASAAQEWTDAAVETVFDLLETDPPAALALAEGLAGTGEPDALNLLAVLLREPVDGIQADPLRARALLERAIEGGSDAARLNLAAEMLWNDDPSDDPRGFALVSAIDLDGPLAAPAGYLTGRALLFGLGAPQDLARGSALMERAAEADPDNADAQFLAARAFEDGWGRPADPERAYEYMRRAADLEEPRAQWRVGMMLLNGNGVPTNPELAYRFVRRSGEAGYGPGQISTAVMLAIGQGVESDPAQARLWYKRAAEEGSAHALRGLGMMLLTGEGGPLQPEVGAAYLALAAEAGDALAVELRRQLHGEILKLDARSVQAARVDWIARFGTPR